MALKHLEAETFESEVKSSAIPIIVDFWAQWCHPCTELGPKFEELSKEYEGKITFAKFDADTSQEILQKFGIMGIPCMIMFHHGEEIGRITGNMPKPYLKQKIDEIAKKAK